MSKEIDFTSTSSKGGKEEFQNSGFKSDLRCHLSQPCPAQESHIHISKICRLMIRGRFKLLKNFFRIDPIPVLFPYCTMESVRESNKVHKKSMELIAFSLVTQPVLHLGKKFHFATEIPLVAGRKC